MSGEGDDLLYQSAGALLFPDLPDNGEELDFTKDFFSDDLSHSNDLNGPSYESMGGDDLIAELEGQDVFTRLPSASELDEGTSFGVDADLKGGLSLSSPARTKPFANGQILPTYGSFQKPSINLAHMNTGGFSGGGPVSEMYMHRNGISGLASPTSPALKSSGLLSPGATSEKLNSLTLEHHQQIGYSPYRQAAFDVKGNVSRSFSKGGPYSPSGVVVQHNSGGAAGGDKRFPSSPLSPSVSSSQGKSNGISLYAASGGQDLLAGSISTSVSDGMHSSSPTHPVLPSDGASPRSLSNSSVEAKDSAVDCMLVSAEGGGVKIQQNKKPFFLSSPGLAHRLGSAVDTSGFVDANGDALRPLSMQQPQHAARSSAMQRSFSSHALGQLRNIAPMSSQGSSEQLGSFSQRIGPSDGPSRLSNESGSPHNMQPQLSDLHNAHIRPLMQSMRRVHSTGDIQTLNGMAGGGTSPSALDRPNYEDGGFKIGRYTMEERKIRIHRYQQKRTQRNFNKKIKYACRKTLADSRPRVRGRFAKNDEVGELQVKNENKDEDEEEGDFMYGAGEDDFFVDEDSSGDLSDVLGMGVKLENLPAKGVKLEHHHALDRKQLLQT